MRLYNVEAAEEGHSPLAVLLRVEHRRLIVLRPLSEHERGWAKGLERLEVLRFRHYRGSRWLQRPCTLLCALGGMLVADRDLEWHDAPGTSQPWLHIRPGGAPEEFQYQLRFESADDARAARQLIERFADDPRLSELSWRERWRIMMDRWPETLMAISAALALFALLVPTWLCGWDYWVPLMGALAMFVISGLITVALRSPHSK